MSITYTLTIGKTRIMNQLKKDGILVGYPDGAFNGKLGAVEERKGNQTVR